MLPDASQEEIQMEIHWRNQLLTSGRFFELYSKIFAKKPEEDLQRIIALALKLPGHELHFALRTLYLPVNDLGSDMAGTFLQRNLRDWQREEHKRIVTPPFNHLREEVLSYLGNSERITRANALCNLLCRVTPYTHNIGNNNINLVRSIRNHYKIFRIHKRGDEHVTVWPSSSDCRLTTVTWNSSQDTTTVSREIGDGEYCLVSEELTVGKQPRYRDLKLESDIPVQPEHADRKWRYGIVVFRDKASGIHFLGRGIEKGFRIDKEGPESERDRNTFFI
ncbi:MAG: hypothetical protein KDD42_03125 [Bdellovibrionales bacterium]|nr:hypothetical protein [Bdellovibrionales bacterium]